MPLLSKAEPQPGADEAVADIVERRWGSTLGSKLGALIRAACTEAYSAGRARGIEEGKDRLKAANQRLARAEAILGSYNPSDAWRRSREAFIADAIAKETPDGK